MNRTYDIEIPYLLTGPAHGRFIVFDRRLYGSDDHFIRLDLYPLIAPSHMRRHYGWWDIPLKHIKQESTAFVFDFKKRVLHLENQKVPLEIRHGWRGPVEEDGYCMLHVSLWDKSKEPPHMMQIKSQPLVIAATSLDLPLKQICIPVTDRCNLKCTMCPRQATDEIVDMDISDEALEPLLDAGANFVSALLQGFGEPLLYPKIFNLIPRVKARMADGGEVGFTTNATLLDEPTAVRLLDTGIDFLYFSLDAASKEVYEVIRVGARFDKVTENIRRCTELQKASGQNKLRFMLNFVILEQNLHEIPAFVSLAARLGVEHVTFSYCTDTDTGGLKAFGTETLQDLFCKAREEGKRLHINIDTPPLHKNPREICFFMERVVALLPGEAFPCHAMAPGYRTQARNRSFGDVRRIPLLEIWKSPDYQEFRRRILRGDFPAECADCECKAYLVP